MDNAATSFPKPEAVYRAVEETMRTRGGNPGRSGHSMALAANRVIFNAREALAKLFSIKDSSRLIFTSSTTEALNLAIKGIVREDSHVITSEIEHSSVSRPLYALQKKGLQVSKTGCDREGRFDPEKIKKAIKGNTSLIVLTHASNVIGTIEPIGEIGALARERGIPFLLDAAQTAGSIPIDVNELNIDLLAAAGHKSLLGLQGTGLLYIAPHIDLVPLKEGGTGAGISGDEQPLELPDRFEAGTMNTPGIAGLGTGVEFILKEGPLAIRQKETSLIKRLIGGLAGEPLITIYGSLDAEKRVSLLSFNIRGIDSTEVAYRLDDEYGIMTRGGLHCAADAHKFLGTYPGGCVRISPGFFNTNEEIDTTIAAILEIAGRK